MHSDKHHDPTLQFEKQKITNNCETSCILPTCITLNQCLLQFLALKNHLIFLSKNYLL